MNPWDKNWATESDGNDNRKPWEKYDDAGPRDAAATTQKSKSEDFPPTVGGYVAQFGTDLVKRMAGAMVSGVASVPLGIEKGVKGTIRGMITGGADVAMPGSVYSPSLDTDETIFGPETGQQKAARQLAGERAASGIPNLPGARALADAGKSGRDALHAATSGTTRTAVDGSQITGNVLKGQIDFGKDPSVRGYVMQAADVFGSMLPVVATAIATKNPTAGAAVGGAMAAGEGADNAREFMAKKTDAELMEQSPFFAKMVEGGASPQEARQLTLDKAQESAALLQGIVASVGDKFTGKLVTGKLDGLLTKAAGKSIAGRTAAGGVISGGEEGVQELTEGIVSDLGIASAVPTKEIGEDSAANLVLGALGGGPMGAGRGVVSGVQARRAEKPMPTEPAPLPEAAPIVANADQPAPAAPATSVATANTDQAEAALRTPVNLTALDRATEIDSSTSKLQERLAELSSENGYGPTFDEERQNLAGEVAQLQQERDAIAATWPTSIAGAPTQFSTESGAKLDAQYALMDAGDLITSHDEYLRPTPTYPKELQPRDRSRDASEVQVASISQKLDPARLGVSADAATGAPIVGADGLVESGNARTIALKRVYKNDVSDPERTAGLKSDEYRQFLKNNAAQFGLSPESVDGMAQPVLVRVRSTPVNRAEFARQANASTVQRMSPSEQALTDAKRMTSLEGLNPDEDGNFGNNMDFVRQFMGTLPITEQSDLIESDGRLSTAGYRRMQNAVLARAYGDSPSLRRMTESMDNNLLNISKALVRVAPTIAAARERMDAGTLHQADIAPDLLSAVEGLSALKEKGWTPAQELAQVDLTGPKYSPEAAQVLTFLSDNARSPRRIADFFQRYYDALEQAGDPSQPSMFGDDGPAPARTDLLNKAQGATDGNNAQNPERGVAGEGAQPVAQDGRQPQDAPGNAGGNEGNAAGQDDPSGRPSAQPGRQGATSETTSDAKDGWVSFPADSGTLGIPRRDMPQIKGEHRGAMVNFLAARGIENTKGTISPDKLKATQAEFSSAKVARIAKSGNMGDRSILISSDNHVLDGHHQWMAHQSAGTDAPFIRLNAPIGELLAAVREFPSVGQSEGTKDSASTVVTQQEPVEEATASATQKPAKDVPPTVGDAVVWSVNGQELTGEVVRAANKGGALSVRATSGVSAGGVFNVPASKAKKTPALETKAQAATEKIATTQSNAAPTTEPVTQRIPDATKSEQDKPAQSGVLSTTAAKPAQGLSVKRAQDVADSVLDHLGIGAIAGLQVVREPGVAGFDVPASVVPQGATRDGKIYLFAENLSDEAEAFKVVVHEVFHLGLSKSVEQGAYIQTMLRFLSDPLVREYAQRWKASEDGVARKTSMPVNNWQALAVEEALADIAEEMNTERGDSGTRKGWTARMARALADLAVRAGLPGVANKIRALTRTEAESFVQAVMQLAGEVEARNTQARQGMTAAQRKATAPEATADVPASDVIVTFNGKEMAEAPAPANAASTLMDAPAKTTQVAEVRAAITKAYGSLLDKLEKKGLVVLVQSEAEAIRVTAKLRAQKKGTSIEDETARLTILFNGPAAVPVSGGDIDIKRSTEGEVQGFFDQVAGKAVLIADGLTAQSAGPVLMHEVGIHMASDGTLKPLFDRAAGLLRIGPKSEFLNRVRERMASAGEKSGEEAAAYITEEYERDRASAPATVTKWIDDLTAAVRAWLFRRGVVLKAGQLTVADIAAVARANARSLAAGRRGSNAARPAFVPAFSIERDAGERGADAVQVQPTAADRAQAIIEQKVAGGAPMDAIGRAITQATGIERLTSASYEKIGFFLDRMTPERIKAGIISDYGVPEAVIDRRTLLQSHQRVRLRKAGTLIEKLATLTRAESRVAYEWMNMDGADPKAYLSKMEGLPEESVKVLQEVQQMIDKLSQEAVELGQLDPEAFKRNRFAYLRRSYAKHILEQTSGDKAKRSRTISVLGEQYKGRGMSEAVPMDRMQAVKPEWWGRKLAGGNADTALKGEKFIRLERRAPSGEGTTPIEGMEGKATGKLLQVTYWPADEPIPGRYAEWRREGTWEVRDTKGGNVVLWRDFTKDEREKMGEVDEARFAIAKTLHAMIHDVETGRYLEWLAHTQAKKEGDTIPGTVVEASENMRNSFKLDEWVQVPTSKIPGTSVTKYGKLAGRYLPGPVWNDLRQVVSGRTPQSEAGKIWGKVLTMWKTSKTALSPTVHMNNVMSNFVMADWHDVRAPHIAKSLRLLLAASDMKGGIADRDAAKEVLARYQDSGGEAGSWATQEMARDQVVPLLESLEKELALNGEPTVETQAGIMAAVQHAVHARIPAAMDAAASGATGKFVAKAGGMMLDAYQAEDELFRLAAWLAAKEDGLSDLQAGKRARKSFLDYNINAPWINIMRQSVLPFVSFSYRAIPMLAEVAGKKPHKLLKLMAIAGALNALGSMMAGGDDDEERKLLPEEKAGGIWGMVPKLIRMPWNDDHNSPVYLDVRRWVPMGDVFDLGQGHSAVPLPPSLMPGGPLAILGELVLNRSAFTGKALTLETDTPAQQAAKVADYLYKAFVPNILGVPGTYATTGVMGALKGRTDAFGREMSVTQAVLSSYGLKLGSYPADVMRRNLVTSTNAQIREIDIGISQLKRQYQTGRIDIDEFRDSVRGEQAKKVKLALKLREKLN